MQGHATLNALKASLRGVSLRPAIRLTSQLAKHSTMRLYPVNGAAHRVAPLMERAIAMIDPQDVAAAAAVILTEDEHDEGPTHSPAR